MKRITKCRACGSPALSPALNISGMASGQNGFFGGGAPREEEEYVFCDSSQDENACGLLQRKYESEGANPSQRMPSGTYRATRNHLRTVATEALELVSGRECSVLDIGCSDGSLLSYYPRWVERVGVEPDDIVDQVGVWASTYRTTFPSPETHSAFKERQFDIVTAISVFEDIDDPAEFLRSVKDVMTDDGIFVLETLYAPVILTRTCVDSFFEKRSAFYSLSVLEALFREVGMKIFRGALTDKDGGSVRLYVTHDHVEEYDFDPWYERLARLWDEENALGLRLAAPYRAFEGRAAEACGAFRAELDAVSQRGDIAHILGAGPTAAELYAWAGGKKSVVEAAVVPYNPSSDERLFSGGPPLVSTAEANALEPDIFIAPAVAKREVLEQWQEPIMRGARILFASPYPHMVHAGNFAAEFGKSMAEGDGAGGPETLRAILGAAGGPRLVFESTPEKQKFAG